MLGNRVRMRSSIAPRSSTMTTTMSGAVVKAIAGGRNAAVNASASRAVPAVVAATRRIRIFGITAPPKSFEGEWFQGR
jgi:hypothetical protein